jgi:hypothetical protein
MAFFQRHVENPHCIRGGMSKILISRNLLEPGIHQILGGAIIMWRIVCCRILLGAKYRLVFIRMFYRMLFQLINHLRKDQSSETNSISSYDSSSMGQLTSDEFETLLKDATRAARRRRKHRRSCRRRSSLSHSDSEISAILPADNVLCRELYFEDELDDTCLEDSTLHASSFLLTISDKG